MIHDGVTHISRISAVHFVRLTYRSLLFLTALSLYLFQFISDDFTFPSIPLPVMAAIWCVFIFEMVSRFFPSPLEGMGCEKQFARNYVPTGKEFERTPYVKRQEKAVWIIAALWLALNGIFGALYLCKVFSKEVMLLIALVYSVCDMICILFFCPFHTWIMKNKCCGTCRIYNWDYAMMFTPLVFIPGFFSWSLCAVAFLTLIQWELVVYRHPERIYEMTNASLACRNCQEKLCHHKKSLQRYLVTQKSNYSHLLDEQMKKLLEKKESREVK